RGGLGRNHMRALDGSVEFQFALRDVALAALIVVRLGKVHVIQSRGEVDVGVASAASRAVGILDPGVGLGCAILRVVATGAVARIGDGSGTRGVDHGGVVAVAIVAVNL